MRLSARRPAAAAGVSRCVRARVDRARGGRAAARRSSSGFPSVTAAHATTRIALLADGRVSAVYRKQLLPNYTVFDEERYFEPGNAPCVVDIDGTAVGLIICEDVWFAGPARASEGSGRAGGRRSQRFAVSHAAAGGAARAGRRASARNRPSLCLRQPRRRAGRARVRRRVLRHECARRSRAATAGLARNGGARHAREDGTPRPVRGALDPRLEYHVYEALRDGRARLRDEEPVPGRAAGSFRRRRFRAGARRRGRRARARARPRGDDAFAVHALDQPRRCARDGGDPSRRVQRDRDRADVRRVSHRARRTSSRACRPMPPRRTSRRGFAARC